MEYVILIVSLVGIVLGADWLVAGAVSIAKKYKWVPTTLMAIPPSIWRWSTSLNLGKCATP